MAARVPAVRRLRRGAGRYAGDLPGRLRKISRFGGTGTLRGWLCRIAINLLRDQQRTQRRRSDTLARFPSAASADARTGEPFVRRRVHAAVDALGDKLRAVLLMHDVEE